MLYNEGEMSDGSGEMHNPEMIQSPKEKRCEGHTKVKQTEEETEFTGSIGLRV